MKKTILILCLCLSLVLSGCGGGAAAGQSSGSENAVPAAENAAPESALAAEEEAGAAQAALQQAAIEAAAAEEERQESLREAAAAVDEAISAIGTVTMESGETIEAAREAYDSLEAEAQGYVTAYDTLTSAEADYEAMVNAVAETEAAIALLEDMTLDSQGDIDDAWDSYNGLSEELQGYVANYDVLEGAQDAYKALVEEMGAAEVQARIDAGVYEDAISYGEQFALDYSDALGDSDVITLAVQKAKLYQAWSYYNANYLEDTQDKLDELYDEVENETMLYYVDQLQNKLTGWIASIRPSNGKIISSSISGGYGELTVNSGSRDMLIKVEGAYDSSRYIYFFVRADSSATINVPDGDYIVKYASGDVYYGDGAEKIFGRDTSYTEADDTMSFSTSYSGNSVYYSVITLTLYAVAGGNLGSYSIDPGDF